MGGSAKRLPHSERRSDWLREMPRRSGCSVKHTDGSAIQRTPQSTPRHLLRLPRSPKRICSATSCYLLGACRSKAKGSSSWFNQLTPKSKRSVRLIPLSGQASETLARLRTNSVQPDELVFHREAGQPLKRHNLLWRQLRPACKKVGMHGITWHSLWPGGGNRENV